MHGRVEAIGPLLEAERREDALVEAHLLVHRELLVEERRVDARRLAHELGEHGADRPEYLGHLGRLHVRLEVVEERRVGRVLPLEALDVLPLELEVALERRKELREVVRRARLDPHLVAERRRSRQLDAELGRNAPLLLPVAPGDADEAGVVRVVLERLFDGPEALEEMPDLVVDELLVDDAAECRERLGAGWMAAGRHRDLLIPGQDVSRSGEIGDLGEALSERTKVRIHRGGLYRRGSASDYGCVT